MDCLKGLIGFRGCIGFESKVGRYVNDLPGISLESVEKIANDEQESFLGVLEAVENRSLKRFESAVRLEFSKKYSIKSIVESEILTPEVDETDLTNQAGDYRGVVFNFSPYTTSNLQTFYIQFVKVYVKLASGAAVDFVIMDFETGDTLFTTSQELNAGWNIIQVRKVIFQPKIFVAYDSTTIDSVFSELEGNTMDGCGCGCFEFSNCEISVQGASTPINSYSITTGDNTFGIGASISSICKFDPVVCNNQEVFANAFWYLMGAELMSERIHSSRLNRYVTLGKDGAKELREEFEMQFQAELKAAVEGICLDDSDCCLECGGAQLVFIETTM